VWFALGDVDNYVEPFAGSLAVLLARPHAPKTETVNDLDHYIVNFWRALQHDPQAVAHYANNPVNECDLTARHLWLVNTGRERIARLLGDPEYYDCRSPAGGCVEFAAGSAAVGARVTVPGARLMANWSICATAMTPARA
jgi:hypothetical protein